jgi:lipoprotein-anchoring transpeptidase ErfK/SrfK
MNPNYQIASQYVAQARTALQRGDRETARQLSSQAVRIVPDLEDAWLLLAFSAASPGDAVTYGKWALHYHPNSLRARQCLQWAFDWAKQTPAARDVASLGSSHAATIVTPAPVSQPIYKGKTNRRSQWMSLILLAGFGCMIVGILGFFALATPALASIIQSTTLPLPTEKVHWASMVISKPTGIPSTPVPMIEPPAIPTEQPEVPPPTSEPSDPMSDGRWIDVNLSEQRAYAYEGDIIVNSFVVSTGLPDTPTVTGDFQIYVKVPMQDMSGPGYYLPDVPWVMFFYDEYGFHGTYWHSNFGNPMSRGCVNMTIEDARWLYDWASVGTRVSVHY